MVSGVMGKRKIKFISIIDWAYNDRCDLYVKCTIDKINSDIYHLLIEGFLIWIHKNYADKINKIAYSKENNSNYSLPVKQFNVTSWLESQENTEEIILSFLNDRIKLESELLTKLVLITKY